MVLSTVLWFNNVTVHKRSGGIFNSTVLEIFHNSLLIGYVEVHKRQLEILWISGTKVCGLFCVSATATAATERLSEALRDNNVEILWGRQIKKKRWMSSMSARVQLAVEGF